MNWGGYRAGGGELSGDSSPLPSATGNPSTRDFRWAPGTRYRLVVDSTGLGSVVDLDRGETTVVRRLHHGGSEATRLVDPVVWSEVFARCDDPPVTARWSDPQPRPRSWRASYQSVADGGCSNTTARPGPEPGQVDQVTNTTRVVPDAGVMPLGDRR